MSFDPSVQSSFVQSPFVQSPSVSITGDEFATYTEQSRQMNGAAKIIKIVQDFVSGDDERVFSAYAASERCSATERMILQGMLRGKTFPTMSELLQR